MEAKTMDMKSVLRTLVDALDVDIDLLLTKGVHDLRATDLGDKVAEWAKDNPVAWGALVRFLSVAAKRIPADDTILKGTVRDQLSRLPAELHRAFKESPQSRSADAGGQQPPQRAASDDVVNQAIMVVLVQRMQIRLLAHVAQLPDVAQKRFLSFMKETDDMPRWLWLFVLLRLVEAALCGSLEYYLEQSETAEPETFWKDFMVDWIENLNRQFRKELDRLSAQA
jgi:hypothetical protein